MSTKLKHAYVILSLSLITLALNIYVWNYGSTWHFVLLVLLCIVGIIICIQYMRTPVDKTLSRQYSALLNCIVLFSSVTFICVPTAYAYIYYLAYNISEKVS